MSMQLISKCFGLEYEVEDFRLPLEQGGYFGQGVGREFFKWRENFAQKSTPQLLNTCFCAVNRADDHVLKPKDYRPLDDLWMSLGYEKKNIMATYAWNDLDSSVETNKTLTYWIKNWTKT